MINWKTKFRNTYSILFFTILLLVLGISSFIYFSGYFTNKSSIKVKISDFPDGTKVNYKISADDNVVDQGSQFVKQGSLDISIPDNVSYNSSVLSYNLNVEPFSDADDSYKESAKTLDMLLELDRENKSIFLSGSGFDEFSDIEIYKKIDGNVVNIDKTASDWAGLFSMDLMLDQEGKVSDLDNGYNQIELAFQNLGIAGDFDRLYPGRVEVFFGDDNADNISHVRGRYTLAFIKMTEALSAIMSLQTGIVGMFFDASMQLRVQRKHQELMAQAHKDYHPSEQMCRIGTFVRSVAHSESKAELNKHALNRILMNQYLAMPNSSAGYGPLTSDISEVNLYIDKFCDHRDNDGATFSLCPSISTSAVNQEDLDNLNKDIDYTRMLGSKLTLDIDFVDGDLVGDSGNDLEGDEAAIIALAKNLYFPNVFEIPDFYRLRNDMRPYYNSRSFAAKMNVAHSSFLNIVGMKSRAPVGQASTLTDNTPPPAPLGSGTERQAEPYPTHTHPPPDPANPPPNLLTPLLDTRTVDTSTIPDEDAGWAYMKAMLREFGIEAVDLNNDGDATDVGEMTVDEQIEQWLGRRPSYYAQMEVLTKKIYQHPNFYTNLYDKPANVDRIGASIDAITLMHQRDRFESLLRREMLTSLLIEEELSKHVENVNSLIYEQMQANQN